MTIVLSALVLNFYQQHRLYVTHCCNTKRQALHHYAAFVMLLSVYSIHAYPSKKELDQGRIGYNPLYKADSLLNHSFAGSQVCKFAHKAAARDMQLDWLTT